MLAIKLDKLPDVTVEFEIDVVPILKLMALLEARLFRLSNLICVDANPDTPVVSVAEFTEFATVFAEVPFPIFMEALLFPAITTVWEVTSETAVFPAVPALRCGVPSE